MDSTKYEEAKGPWIVIHARDHVTNLDSRVWQFKIHKLYSSLLKATEAAIKASAERGYRYAIYECIGYLKAKPALSKAERAKKRKEGAES